MCARSVQPLYLFNFVNWVLFIWKYGDYYWIEKVIRVFHYIPVSFMFLNKNLTKWNKPFAPKKSTNKQSSKPVICIEKKIDFTKYSKQRLDFRIRYTTTCCKRISYELLIMRQNFFTHTRQVYTGNDLSLRPLIALSQTVLCVKLIYRGRYLIRRFPHSARGLSDIVQTPQYLRYDNLPCHRREAWA